MADGLTLKLMDWKSYLEKIEGLPLPTDAQIENFVNDVLVAHSWYKCLDLGHEFVFGLNKDRLLDEPRSADDTERYGHLQYYWVDGKTGKCAGNDIYNVNEGLPSEIVKLGVKVRIDDYQKDYKKAEMIANIQIMRFFISRRRKGHEGKLL